MKKLLNTVWFQQSWPFAVLAILFTADKISKYWAAFNFQEEAWVVNDFLMFSTYWNTGISFSIFAPSTWAYLPYALAAFAFIVGAGLMWWQRREPIWHRWGAVLVATGAIGNGLDRIQWGAVADFISVHYAEVYYFPTFNLADSFITIGVICFLYQSIFGKKSHAKK